MRSIYFKLPLLIVCLFSMFVISCKEDSSTNFKFSIDDPEFSEVDSFPLLNRCYSRCSAFAFNQLQLENKRISGQAITSDDSLLEAVYSSGYETISSATAVLKLLELQQLDNILLQSYAYAAQMRAVRAFAYYNMAMLWGRVLFLSDSSTGSYIDLLQSLQINQQDAYEVAYTDIKAALIGLPEENNKRTLLFTRSAALMLKAEIELSLKRNADAAATLSQVKVSNNILTFTNTDSKDQTLSIYTNSHYPLFVREADKNVNGLELEWKSLLEHSYGYWAALKRLDKAQEVTGCKEEDLLMPFPIKLIQHISKLGCSI